MASEEKKFLSKDVYRRSIDSFASLHFTSLYVSRSSSMLCDFTVKQWVSLCISLFSWSFTIIFFLISFYVMNVSWLLVYFDWIEMIKKHNEEWVSKIAKENGGIEMLWETYLPADHAFKLSWKTSYCQRFASKRCDVFSYSTFFHFF
jgi:hypothetical protein